MKARMFVWLMAGLFAGLTCFQDLRAEDQGKFTAEKIDAGSVPEAVKKSQESYFPDAKVAQWKKNALVTKQGKAFTQYEAVFMYEKRQLASARYEPDGKGKLLAVLSGEPGLPQAVKEAAKAMQPEFTVKGGLLLRVLSSGKEGYRVTAQKGVQRLYLWLDASGKELSQDYIAEAVKNLWGLNN
jgi:hypothetical protein